MTRRGLNLVFEPDFVYSEGGDRLSEGQQQHLQGIRVNV